MRPIVITQKGVGQTVPIPLDRYLTPFQVTARCIVSGTPTYGLLYTYDDPFSVAPGSIDWQSSSDLPAGTTGNGNASFNSGVPITALALNISGVVAPTDSVKVTINQSGMLG